MDETNQILLNACQDKFPIAVKPYEILGKYANITEKDAFIRMQGLRNEGVIRRLGGVFDSRRLGYFSTLCAAKVPEEKIPNLAKLLLDIPGVTHNYIRDHEYNVWFTLIARSRNVAEQILQTIRNISGISEVHSLPAIRLFKINVNFEIGTIWGVHDLVPKTTRMTDLRSLRQRDESPYELTITDKKLIKELQMDLPDSVTPFTIIAQKILRPVEQVISDTQRLLDAGVIRRFGAVLRHQKAGFVANSMGVWQVKPDQAEQVGEKMATFKEVSHCYQRPTLPDWPYNLFTMVHGRTKEDCGDIMEKISLATGVGNYSMLFSTAELKKSSMQYFIDEQIQ